MRNAEPHVVEMITDLTRKGQSIREISAATGASKNTVVRHQRLLGLTGTLCKCGKPRHRGWCSTRYDLSEARQTFMAQWHGNEQKPDDDLDETYLGQGRTDPVRDDQYAEEQ